MSLADRLRLLAFNAALHPLTVRLAPARPPGLSFRAYAV